MEMRIVKKALSHFSNSKYIFGKNNPKSNNRATPKDGHYINNTWEKYDQESPQNCSNTYDLYAGFINNDRSCTIRRKIIRILDEYSNATDDHIPIEELLVNADAKEKIIKWMKTVTKWQRELNKVGLRTIAWKTQSATLEQLMSEDIQKTRERAVVLSTLQQNANYLEHFLISNKSDFTHVQNKFPQTNYSEKFWQSKESKHIHILHLFFELSGTNCERLTKATKIYESLYQGSNIQHITDRLLTRLVADIFRKFTALSHTQIDEGAKLFNIIANDTNAKKEADKQLNDLVAHAFGTFIGNTNETLETCISVYHLLPATSLAHKTTDELLLNLVMQSFAELRGNAHQRLTIVANIYYSLPIESQAHQQAEDYFADMVPEIKQLLAELENNPTYPTLKKYVNTIRFLPPKSAAALTGDKLLAAQVDHVFSSITNQSNSKFKDAAKCFKILSTCKLAEEKARILLSKQLGKRFAVISGPVYDQIKAKLEVMKDLPNGNSVHKEADKLLVIKVAQAFSHLVGSPCDQIKEGISIRKIVMRSPQAKKKADELLLKLVTRLVFNIRGLPYQQLKEALRFLVIVSNDIRTRKVIEYKLKDIVIAYILDLCHSTLYPSDTAEGAKHASDNSAVKQRHEYIFSSALWNIFRNNSFPRKELLNELINTRNKIMRQGGSDKGLHQKNTHCPMVKFILELLEEETREDNEGRLQQLALYL